VVGVAALAHEDVGHTGEENLLGEQYDEVHGFCAGTSPTASVVSGSNMPEAS
jgi:hypothetical protein